MTVNATKVSAEKPLEGAVLCCTSILPEDRAQLAEYAEEMGAKHTLDLTSNVTHLLVGRTDSEKYQYVAKEREDVKVLLPDWVQALREKWMADEFIDLHALDAKYKCPTLYGLKICITGFEDLDFRNELAKNIAKNGGEYSGDLTKDVTHLVAFLPEGKKYEYAGAWGIKIVSIKWYKDTLDRGMQLDESLYHPAISPDVQGRGAWNRQPAGGTRLGKRPRDDPTVQEPSRKLRRAASARFGSQQNDMWNDIVGRPPSADSNTRPTKLHSAQSLPNVRQSADRNLGHKSEASPSGQVTPLGKDHNTQAQNLQTDFLLGKHFAHKGFNEARKSRLFDVLLGHGANVYQSVSDLLKGAEPDETSRFLIVPHDIDKMQLTKLGSHLSNISIVTELWLEYCMTVKTFVAPGAYPLGAPICSDGIPGISELIINASGFHQVQTMHIAKIVKKMGALYRENFTQETTVLITNSGNPNHQKISYAKSWNVPVVTEKWLWKLLSSDQIPSFDTFTFGTTNRDTTSKQVGSIQTRSSDPKLPSMRRHNSCEGGAKAEDSFLEAVKDLQAEERSKSSDGSDDRSRMDRSSFQEAVATKQMSRSASDRRHQNTMPLQEISTNVMSKPSIPAKKRLFQQFKAGDGARLEMQESVTMGEDSLGMLTRASEPVLHENDHLLAVAGEHPPEIDSNQHVAAKTLISEQVADSELLKEFFEIKAAAEARKSSGDSKSTKNKLIGRALSNLSNSSRKSNEDSISHNEFGKVRESLSRASSINSINTDGLGVPLSNLSRIPSDLVAKPTNHLRRKLPPSIVGSATASLAQTTSDPVLNQLSVAMDISNDDTSFHAALATLSTSQLPRPPSPTQQDQLTYADTDDAARLKAHLAEKRRRRARLGQKETDPAPDMSREEKERIMVELAREESEEKRQAKWRADKEKGLGIKDDEKVVGVGRRTRGREKRLSALGGADLGEEIQDGLFQGL